MLFLLPPVYKKQVAEGKPATATTTAADRGAPEAVFIKSFVFQPDVPIRIDYEARSYNNESLVCVTLLRCNLEVRNPNEIAFMPCPVKRVLSD